MSEDGVACGSCRLGKASGRGEGQFCPFVMRTYPPGAILCRAGAPASYVWFVKAGAVVRRDPADGSCAVVRGGRMLGLETAAGGRAAATLSTPAGATLCGAPREGIRRWLAQHRASAAIHAPELLPMLGDAAGQAPGTPPASSRGHGEHDATQAHLPTFRSPRGDRVL